MRARNCIRLTASGEDLPQDVLVVLKEHQDSSEIIWLSTAASKTLFKIPIDVLSPGANAIKVYTLDKLHCRTGLMIYRKRTSSKEVTYNRRPKSLPPTKLPGEKNISVFSTPFYTPKGKKKGEKKKKIRPSINKTPNLAPHFILRKVKKKKEKKKKKKNKENKT